MTADPFDLARFVTAQTGVFERAVSELSDGRKRSHWMWFVFPQLKALGRSSTAQFDGLASLEEATAYVQHPNTVRASGGGSGGGRSQCRDGLERAARVACS